MPKLSEMSDTPLYSQLRNIILKQIQAHSFPDQKLPSEKELCNEYGVSRITVRQALAQLQREGYLYRKQGRGTFVSPTRIEQDITHLFSFAEEMKKRNLSVTNRVLNLTLMAPSDEVAEKLSLERGERVYFLNRLRYVEKAPLGIEYTFLPERFFPNMEKNDFESVSLYETMRTVYNIYPSKADVLFGAAEFTKDELLYFNSTKMKTALKVERVTIDRDSNIIEYSLASVNPEIYRYHIFVDSL